MGNTFRFIYEYILAMTAMFAEVKKTSVTLTRPSIHVIQPDLLLHDRGLHLIVLHFDAFHTPSHLTQLCRHLLKSFLILSQCGQDLRIMVGISMGENPQKCEHNCQYHTSM